MPVLLTYLLNFHHAATEGGLVEYICIPWQNHCAGNLDDYESWTVNLALWFVHILAGNAHEIDRDYIPLRDEVLRTQSLTASAPTPAVNPSETAGTLNSNVDLAGPVQLNGSFSSLGKRKRDTSDGNDTDQNDESTDTSGDEIADGVHHSFNAERCLGQVRAHDNLNRLR